MSDLDAGLRSGKISVINASQTLADMTSNTKGDGGSLIYGGDILLATRMLKHMSERMHYEIQVSNKNVFYTFSIILLIKAKYILGTCK